MTIRAKLYVAILLTVLGPVITIAVALHGMDRLGDRFDEVQERSDHRALALDLKFDVTDFNGWQTAYGYDDGASRPRFEQLGEAVPGRPGAARNELTDPRETRLLNEIRRQVRRIHAARRGGVQRAQARRRRAREAIFLGPELRLFDAMAQRADELARYEARGASATEKEFDDSREDSRRGLIAVALGAALVIILLLTTASDIARMALEGGRERERQ